LTRNFGTSSNWPTRDGILERLVRGKTEFYGRPEARPGGGSSFIDEPAAKFFQKLSIQVLRKKKEPKKKEGEAC
jgi:hypothetical protein